jgi:trehalose 6-phosphate phosphatase
MEPFDRVYPVKNILGVGQQPILDKFLQQRTLVAFDFDGTLAPIVRDPAAAAMRSRTRQLLGQVARRYLCAVISGRARSDVLTKVKGIPLRAVFGNHGIETMSSPRAVRGLMGKWQAQLGRTLPHIPGLIVEDKGVSLALHYRQAARRTEVRRIVLDAALRLSGKRIVEGKMVVNVLPAGGGDKGTALADLRRRLRCPLAIYVGDDDNDEDVFTLAAQGWLLGIRISRSPKSRAQYFLPTQAAIDDLLARMII